MFISIQDIDRPVISPIRSTADKNETFSNKPIPLTTGKRLSLTSTESLTSESSETSTPKPAVPVRFHFRFFFISKTALKKDISQVKESDNESDRIQPAGKIRSDSGLWTDIQISSVGIGWDPTVGI